MFKRKKDPLEDDFGQNNDLYPTYDDPDSAQKKKRSGCLIAIIVVFVLIIGGFLIHAIRGGSTSLVLQSEPTLTVSVDDGVPAQVAEGLVYASYNASGERTGLYDIQGQEIIESAFAPNSLPTTITQITLSNLDAIAYPQGAFFDPQSGQLIVFGPPATKKSHPASDDFLVVLRAIYSQQDPGVSIDPTNSATVQDVRYIGQTESTHFGWVMFEADRVMKTLSMGQDNITGETIKSTVPSHSTLLDLEFQIGDNNQNEIRRRFWFTVPVVEIEQTDGGQSMIISALALDVKTEYLDSNWETLVNQPPDPAGQAFSQHLTDHYDEYAQEFPVLSDLKALAYWTALAHWLNQTHLPIQSELWLTNLPVPYDAPLTTPAITVTRQNTQGNVIRTMTLWGGVDLGMTLKIHSTKEATLARLKEIFDQFKAWWGIAKVTASSPGLGFAPITPISLEHGLVTQIQISLSPALQLNYSLNRWELGLPFLKRYGAAENSYFLLEDPSATSPVMLTYGGRNMQKNTSVFTNQQAGLWLEEFSDSYQLRRGQFQPDGQFSYLEDDFFVFDLQGRVLQDSSPEAGLVEYTYESGKLTSIQQNGQELAIHWNSDGTIQNTQSGDKKDTFEYEAGLLTVWKDSAGATIRRFEYDSQGRLTHEFGAEGALERLTRYDKQNQLLFQIDQNNATLYDWQPGGTFIPYSGAALVPWQQASEDILEEMKISFRLLRNTQVTDILFARPIDDKVVILVNDRSYTVPDYMLKNPAGLRSKLAAIVVQDHPGDLVLISNRGIQGVAFPALFPNATPLIVEKMDEAQIQERLRVSMSPHPFTPGAAQVINLIPQPDQLASVGLDPNDKNLWHVDTMDENSQSWKDLFDGLIKEEKFGDPMEYSDVEIKYALSNYASVFFIIGHGDTEKIYIPGGADGKGTVFAPENLSEAEIEKIKEQKPFVFSFFCDTALATDDKVSFAQLLLDSGSSLVVAPNGKLPVDDAYEIMQNFFENLKKNPDALPAIMQAIKSKYPNWIISTKDGFEYFIEIRTWIISSDELEA